MVHLRANILALALLTRPIGSRHSVLGLAWLAFAGVALFACAGDGNARTTSRTRRGAARARLSALEAGVNRDAARSVSAFRGVSDVAALVM